MPKKQPGERWRYIAFAMEGGPFARNDFLDSLIAAARGTPLGRNFRITVFEPGLGILKVPHTMKQHAIDVLSSMDSVGAKACRVRTLKTSGTIKTLKDKYLTREQRMSRE